MEQRLDNLEFGGLLLFAFLDFGFETWLNITVKVLAGAGLIYKIIETRWQRKYNKKEHALKLEALKRQKRKDELEIAVLRKQLDKDNDSTAADES